MVVVRMLNADDSIAALTSLLNRAYAVPAQQGIFYTAATQSEETTVRRALAGVCFVACDGSRIVGTLAVSGPQKRSQLAYLTRPTVAQFSQFAVDPDYQGRGVGLALIDAAIECITEDGFEEVVGDVVASYSWLLDWYRRIGFVPVEEFQWEGRSYRSVLVSRRLNSR